MFLNKLLFKNFCKGSQKSTNQILDKIELMNNLESKRYYLMNGAFLAIYGFYNFYNYYNFEQLDYFKSTFLFLGAISTGALMFLIVFSNRHIKKVTLSQNKKELYFETFRLLGLMKKEYVLNINDDIKVMINLKQKYLLDYGFYQIKLRKQYFRNWNCFIIRPINIKDRNEFDKIFKKLYKTDQINY